MRELTIRKREGIGKGPPDACAAPARCGDLYRRRGPGERGGDPKDVLRLIHGHEGSTSCSA